MTEVKELQDQRNWWLAFRERYILEGSLTFDNWLIIDGELAKAINRAQANLRLLNAQAKNPTENPPSIKPVATPLFDEFHQRRHRAVIAMPKGLSRAEQRSWVEVAMNSGDPNIRRFTRPLELREHRAQLQAARRHQRAKQAGRTPGQTGRPSV